MQIRRLKIRPTVSIVLLIMIALFSQPSSVDGASVVRDDKDIYDQSEMIRVHFMLAAVERIPEIAGVVSTK